MRTAVRELGLGGSVSVVSGRAETLAPAAYDAALSRATLAPAEWVTLARTLVRPGGRIFVLTVPETNLPGRRTTYLHGRRTLIELTPEECST